MEKRDTPFNILFIEDNEDDALLVQRQLTKTGIPQVLVRTQSEAGIEKALEQHSFDIVISDYGLPGFDGLTALKIVREAQPLLPFIFVTGTLGDDKAVECLKAGATDFVRKEYLDRLVPAFERAIKERDEYSQRLLAEEKTNSLLQVVEQASDVIITTDTQGIVQYVNGTFEAQFGYTKDEVIGKNVQIILDKSSQGSSFQKIHSAISEGEPFRRFVTVQRKDKSLFLSNMLVSQVKDSLGMEQSLAIFIQDVSKEKLLEKQLQQAQKLEAIGTLAGGIAHDFNNIISAILGYTELISEENDLSSNLQEHLAEIKGAGLRASSLVTQILSFSRNSEQRKFDVEIEPIIKELEKMLWAMLPSTITIETKIGDNLGQLHAQPTQIHQLLMNLCINSFHAMEKSGGTLTISAQMTNSNKQKSESGPTPFSAPRMCLSVQDTGVGMETEIKEKIFQTFFTTKKPGSGTGLGLSIVQDIVGSYGGKIEVQSTPGEGTTFDMYLPVVKGKAIDKTQRSSQTFKGNNEHLLWVDDEKALAHLYQMFFTQLGYKVSSFTDSAEALQFFYNSEEDIDLVITDQTMPQFTGGELISRILKTHPKLPIILYTGYSSIFTSKDAEYLGVAKYLQKPFSNSEMAKIIHDLLEKNA